MSTLQESLDLFFNFSNRLRNTKKNIFQKNKLYRIMIVSSPTYYDSEVSISDGSVFLKRSASGKSSAMYAVFKGRILDNKMAHQKFLKMPDDSSIAEPSKSQSILRSLHIDVLVSLEKNQDIPSEGDVVFGYLEPGTSNNIYSLQSMKIEKKVEKSSVQIRTPNRNYPSPRVEVFFGDAWKNSGAKTLEDSVFTLTGETYTPTVNPLFFSPKQKDDVHLIFFYAGIPSEKYGKQFIEDQILPTLNLPDDVLLIVGDYDENIVDMYAAANLVNDEELLNISKTSIVGWSGGIQGVINQLNAIKSEGRSVNDDIDDVLLIDPDPARIVSLGSNSDIYPDSTTMEYIPNVWPTNLSQYFPQAGDIIRKAGGSADDVSGDFTGNPQAHFYILADRLKGFLNR